jgi:hypothetical protein
VWQYLDAGEKQWKLNHKRRSERRVGGEPSNHLADFQSARFSLGA